MPLFLPPLRAVASAGIRRSISRAKASAARRTSTKDQRGTMRTLTCMPREPLVFGQPCEAQLVEQSFHADRDPADVVPRHARARIEIDAQLVRMIEVGGAHRVRVQLEAAEVDDPGEAGGVVDDDLLGGPPRRKREGGGAKPAGALLGRSLLVEDLALGAVDEPLQNDGPVGDPARAPATTDW